MYNKFKYESRDQYTAVQQMHVRTMERTANHARRLSRLSDIETIKSSFPGKSRVLCVGARDRSEVVDFTTNEFFALGVDLFSSCEEIKVVDMHDLAVAFDPKSFDVAYMSHSLEHSYDPKVVIDGLRSVCTSGCLLVLPAWEGLVPTSKDPIVFEFMKFHESTIEKVQSEFDDVIGKGLSVTDVRTRVFEPRTAGRLYYELIIIVKF